VRTRRQTRALRAPAAETRRAGVTPSLHSLAFGFRSVRKALAQGVRARDIVAESCYRAQALADAGIFTELVPSRDAIRRAERLQKRADAGAHLPLLGLTFTVKDNIHVAGMATTCNCPGFRQLPSESAPAVRAVEKVGAVLIGKNTLDQFATGLNGTRSPEPVCRNAVNPAYIPGGSSSGSAVAVARDVVSFALGSDTGGSGRVPAACNGIIGLKPTLGLVSSRGLVYNSRYFDCIPVFARTCGDAYEILEQIAGYDPDDPFSRPDADRVPLAAPPKKPAVLAIPRADQLEFFDDLRARAAFEANVRIIKKLGYRLREIDFTIFAEAGRHVFQSAMVAERLCDYGEIFATNPEAIHPAVRAAIEPGKNYSAVDVFKSLYHLKALQRRAASILDGCAALIVPTVPTIFAIDEMLADPMAKNAIMGTYTYFVNPLDMAAVSVPGRLRSDGLPSAVCFVGAASTDGVLRGLAQAFEAAVTREVG
jgi:allophanate hydrolase